MAFRGRVARRTAQALALACLTIYALHTGTGLLGTGFDGFAQDVLYNTLIAASAGFCIWRGMAARAERAAWLLLGAGLASWFAGELYFTLHLSHVADPPYPSLSDALYLAFYPASYLGLTLLLRSRVKDFPVSHWVDGAVAALAVAAFGSALLMGPVMESTGGDLGAAVTDLAYPLADVLLLSLVIGTFALTGWRPGRSWSLIGMALVAIALADGVFLYQASAGSYVDGGMLDAAWPAATLLLGFAAWVQPEPVARQRLEGWRTLLIPSAFALGALGLLMLSQFHTLNEVSVAFAGATLVAAIARMGLTFGENMKVLAHSRGQAMTDALTGLGNRRSLMEHLEDALEVADEASPLTLVVLDLDGFKRYNDSFGHPAGDALLARLGGHLKETVEPEGAAYRLGGDEFCALIPAAGEAARELVAATADALADSGEAFSITASRGSIELPFEASTAERALQLADQRLYGAKAGRSRAVAAKQTRDALMQALQEREPGLKEHIDQVAGLSRDVGRALDMSSDEIDVLVRAAELHDIGKVAVPDSILRKPGPLDDTEWGFVRQHTVVGERILSAAPALVPVARIVRASHERFDGRGYPDGSSGEDIPLGARIVAICDAYHAITSERPYGQARPHEVAIDELRRCAGHQFDPRIVEIFCSLVDTAPRPNAAGARVTRRAVEVS